MGHVKGVLRDISGVDGQARSVFGADERVQLNPFALAIRPPLTEAEVMDEVARTPPICEAERALPANVRRELVLRLDDFVEPLPRFFELESRISAMIRAGYARRNPLPIGMQRQLAEKQGLDPSRVVTAPPVTLAPGLSLIGFSGVGKTTAVSSILNLHTQLHSHSRFLDMPFHQTQLVWVRVACPPTGGPRALLMNIFQEIDRLLGTDYHRRYANARRSAAELIPNLVDLMSTLGLGLLVIDEIQRLVRMGAEEAQLLLDVFTHLRTESHTPVMLIGTPKAMRVLDSAFEQGRRNTSMGHIDWQPMDNNDTWSYFVEQMWGLQWLSTPSPLTKDLLNELYECSQGITDLAVKIFKMAQFTIIGHEKEQLSPKLFKDVVRTEFGWFRPWIPLLKRRAPELMSGLFDQMFEPKGRTPKRAPPLSDPADLSTVLLRAGLKKEELHYVLTALSQRRQPEEATESASTEPKAHKKKATKPAGRTGISTLWDLVKQQPKLSGHDALLEAGHVRLPISIGI